MKKIFTFFKRADVSRNRIIIPKIIIDKYGRDFYFEIYDDGTIKLIPATNKKED